MRNALSRPSSRWSPPYAGRIAATPDRGQGRGTYRRMQRLGQPLDHVAGFMKLAALDWRVGAEGATDDFAQRLGAVDNEQPADLGIKPSLDQIVDERLHDGGVLGCSFD